VELFLFLGFIGVVAFVIRKLGSVENLAPLPQDPNPVPVIPQDYVRLLLRFPAQPLNSRWLPSCSKPSPSYLTHRYSN
jgi:hypothetical protein